MSLIAPSTERWVVSCRGRDQVSTVDAQVQGLEIVLLGIPEGFSRDEVEGWIGSLAAASREGAVAASPDDPIPPVLRHVLGGLLFSHAELWGRSAVTPCTVVLVNEHGRVAFGWVGTAVTRIYEDGHELEPEWVRVRDHQGREAHAWCGDARREIRVDLLCTTGSGAGADTAELEATWPAMASEPVVAIADARAFDEEPAPPAGPVAVVPPAPGEPVSAPVDRAREAFPFTPSGHVEAGASGLGPPPDSPVADAPVTEVVLSAEEVSPLDEAPSSGDRPSSGVARWLAQALGWRKRPRDVGEMPRMMEAEPAPAPGTPSAAAEGAAIGPSAPEPSRVEANETQDLVTAEADASPGLVMPIELVRSPDTHVSLDHEPVVERDSQEIDVPLPPGVPDRIPPTPEAPEVTARATRESFSLDDPRAISLPDEKGPAAVEVRTQPAVSPVPVVPVAPPAAASLPVAPMAASPPVLPPGPPVLPKHARSTVAAREMAGETGSEIRSVDLPLAHQPVVEPGTSAAAEVPGGFTAGVGEARATGPAARRRRPRRPTWPAPAPSEPRPGWSVARWGGIAAFVLVLFGAGWLVGSLQGNGVDQKPSPMIEFLRRIGLAGARFETRVTSRPEGAEIAVDGKDTGMRTPATIELPPGEHRIDLSFADLGSASYVVKGVKGEKVPLEATLWGAVDVTVSDASTPISVAVDGEPRGFAPMVLDSLAPGPHELRFTGPGMASWGTTVEVRVGESREVLAYPLQSPATGLLQVRAVINREGESQALSGARVFVDGGLRGPTPLTLELPRGPHSVRVTHQSESAPVQVIDLPGGNQRFATFEFGLGLEAPSLTLRAPSQIPADEPVLISATLGQVAAADVREMWLHVRTPDNRWRRYPMTLIDAQGSAVGAAPFPAVLLGTEGATRYYVSVLTAQGDEYFTEMQSVTATRGRPTR